MQPKQIIVIAGPTASGKTSLAVALALRLNCPIISADSRQCYRELSIGTAKPSMEERKGVPHYFIDSHSVQNPLTSGQYEKEATALLQKLFKTEDTLVLVGGSGMFIHSLLYGTDKIPQDENIRATWNQQLENRGIHYLQDRLKKVDPVYFKEVDIQNPVRLIRALEVYTITGQPYSDLRKNTKKKARYLLSYFVLDHPRDVLYNKINLRVNQMIESGLVEEVAQNSIYRDLQPLNTIGYKEIFQYLDHAITLEEAIELLQRNTRRYAKRQLTWFRREKESIWLKAAENKILIPEILNSIYNV